MSFWRRRDLATPRPIGSNAAPPVSQEPEDSSREWYIRTLVEGYRKGDMPIPGWLQTEWDDLGLVEPPAPAVYEDGKVPEGWTVEILLDNVHRIPLEKMEDMVYGAQINRAGAVTGAVLVNEGQDMCWISLNNMVQVGAGCRYQLSIDGLHFHT